MHAKFNLTTGCEPYCEYTNTLIIDEIKSHFATGKKLYDESKLLVETNLKKFENGNKKLVAEEIIDNWFPNINADIFLSHSHKDEDLVIGFAGWLNDKFRLKCFIDSTVWGYSDKLLKLIDDQYCKNNSDNTYNYDLRNRSTSHVHMMLSTALANMIDKCECIIFVNTPNSYIPAVCINNNGTTESPWIYNEISMSRIIRKKSVEEYRSKLTLEELLTKSNDQNQLTISYPLDMFHLIPLNFLELKIWEDYYNGMIINPLDLLYKLKRKIL